MPRIARPKGLLISEVMTPGVNKRRMLKFKLLTSARCPANKAKEATSTVDPRRISVCGRLTGIVIV
jgi:hypothetical protein